jgi:DNA-binding IclR family transcriptional regulator
MQQSPATALETARPAYAVPALEKALDIIELLAGQTVAPTGSQIAGIMRRSPGEIFRILQCLERRQIIERKQPGERFSLTTRLLELGLRHPPVDRLLTSAIPVMQELAQTTRQSCHLSMRNGAHILIVAQVASPAAIGFSVRRGARFPLAGSISGRVLLAFRKPAELRLWLSSIVEESGAEAVPADLSDQLAAIRAAGYARSDSLVCPGVVDIGAPVIDDSGAAVAALTVPYFAMPGTRLPIEALPDAVCAAARRISDELGGGAQRLPVPGASHVN